MTQQEPSQQDATDGSEGLLFAIVVTFHPDANVLENLTVLHEQAANVVVVDNGSLEAELAPLRALCAALGLRLLENGENLGIATGMNRGIRAAVEAGADWTLLFDQDSRVTPGFVTSVLGGFAAGGTSLGLLVPVYRDMRFGVAIPAERMPDGDLAVAMTSGSLLAAETFGRYGYFADELFIDAVDHEYSLRLRSAGLRLRECSDAELLHSPGIPTFYSVGGWKFQTANYAPVRRYYQERNKIWMYRRYGASFPQYCFRLFVVSLKDLAKIALLEDNKARKMRYFLRGVWDGIRGRMGAISV